MDVTDAPFDTAVLERSTEVPVVVDLWAERPRALLERPDVAYVLVFENRGREVGATIDHPHPNSRHRRGESYAVRANPILGGPHHEYSLVLATA